MGLDKVDFFLVHGVVPESTPLVSIIEADDTATAKASNGVNGNGTNGQKRGGKLELIGSAGEKHGYFSPSKRSSWVRSVHLPCLSKKPPTQRHNHPRMKQRKISIFYRDSYRLLQWCTMRSQLMSVEEPPLPLLICSPNRQEKLIHLSSAVPHQ